MFKRKYDLPAAAILGATCVALLLLAFLLEALVGLTWSLGIMLLALSGLTATGSTILARRLWSDAKAGQRCVEQLARTMAGGAFSATSLDSLASLPCDSPLAAACSSLRNAVNQMHQHFLSAEQARAALEVRLRRQETRAEQVAAILSGLPEPVVAIDNLDEVVLANPSAEQLLKFNSSDVEKRALARLIHCEQLVELLTDARRRRTVTQRSAEVELIDSAGELRWYNITARALNHAAANGAANSGGAVAVLRDVSAQKAMQRRNAQFVSDVSHEMKTPLAGIKAYIELLLDGDAETPEMQEEFLTVISSQANRLQRLVDNLLNLARIEAGVVNVSKQSQSLNELLEEAFRVVQPAADAKHITLSLDLSPMYLGVLIDRDMILQAAINLLSNAIKYTPDRGKVVLRSRLVGSDVRFEVEDTGVGLSPEDCQKVFEKFYRVQKDKDMAPGTGLGLPLVKHIVEDVHSGRIIVESTPGAGSIFSVALPGAGQALD